MVRTNFVLVDLENVQPRNIGLLYGESIPERVDALLDNLIKCKAAKPRTVETLRNTIKTCFANKLSDHEIQALLDQLAQRGVIRVSEGKVIYELPP